MSAFNPKFTITNRVTAAITHIERARGFLEAATLSDDWVRNMGNKALIKEAHHTTHIEGSVNKITLCICCFGKAPESDSFRFARGRNVPHEV